MKEETCWLENRSHVLKEWPHPQRHPFPEKGGLWEKKGERRGDTTRLMMRGRGTKANILSLTVACTVWLLCTREKINSFRNVNMYRLIEAKIKTRHTLIHPRMNTIHLSLYNLTFMMFGSSFDPLICAFLHCITGICRFKRTCISRHTARIV